MIKLFLIFMVLISSSSYGLTCTSAVGAVNWGTVATWSCGRVPTTADSVVVPNGSTLTLNVNSNAISAITINSGGILYGDNTGKILSINGTGGNDVVNNGTLDFSASRYAILRNSSTSAMNITQTVGVASVWKFSSIDFNNRGATLTQMTQIEFNGNATPFVNTSAAITNNSAPDCTWLFSGSVAQTLTTSNIAALAGSTTRVFSSTTSLATINVTNTSSSGLTIQANLTGGSSIRGSLNVAAGATLTLDTSATDMVNAIGGYSFASTSTVRYARNNTQNVRAGLTYGNLEITNGSTKTMLAGTHNIAGNFTLGPATTYNGTTNNPIVNLAGNFSNSGTFNSGTGVFTFNGNSTQTLTGATTLSNAAMNNNAIGSSRILSLANDLTIATNLNFASGRILTGSNKVIMNSGTSVTGAASGTGWVAGNLQKLIPAGASTTTFEVGTNGASSPSLGYAPVSTSFTGVGGAGGSLLAFNTLNDHPSISSSGLDSTQSVNRYWTLTTTGVTGTTLPAFTNYSAIFNFNAFDQDAGTNPSAFLVNQWNGATWSPPTTGTRNAANTQATGLTALGDFILGHSVPPSVTKVSVLVSDPINNTTNPKSIPGAIRDFTITVANPGYAYVNNSTIITDSINSNLGVFVNDLGGAGSGPVAFTQGTPSSALTYTFTTLSSLADDVDFSNNGGATWVYVPTPGANGCDNNVTNIRINPKGTFASGLTGADPNFQIRFRSCVK